MQRIGLRTLCPGIVLTFLFFTASNALGDHINLTLLDTQPDDDSETVFYAAREAAHSAGDPDTYKIKGEFILRNDGPDDLTATFFTISFPGTSVPSYTDVPVKGGLLTGGGGQRRIVFFYDHGVELQTPLPDRIDVSLEFDGETETYNRRFPLVFYDSDNVIGGQFFPASIDDLAPGESWNYRNRHVENATTGSTGGDRYAYDFAVVKWHNGAYEIKGTDDMGNLLDGTENWHFLAFGKPQYAVADGQVILCVRGVADNVPGVLGNGGGNELFIQYGNEVVRYAHFMDDSIPFELCPFDDGSRHDVESMNIFVEAGQQIGLTGNSGQSSDAHIHTSIHRRPDRSQPYGFNLETGDGYPLNYHNIRIASDPSNYNNLGDNPAFRASHGRIIPSNTLIIPNLCGFDFPEAGSTEVSRHGIAEECFQDEFNLIVSRGYRPIFIDGYEAGGNNYFNVTFRQSGRPWIARHGLTGAQYQDFFDEVNGPFWQLLQVDSYVRDGQVRYAAIFEYRPGGRAFEAFHGLNDAEFDTRLDDLADSGFVPVNVSAVHLGGEFYWTGLFELVDVTGWTVETVPVANYQSTFDDNVAAGRLPTYVHGVSTPSGPYVTGIWIDPIGGSYAAVHGLTSAEYQSAFETNLASGRLTRYTSGYDNGAGSARFAAIWRGRPNTLITQSPPSQTAQANATFEFTSNNPFTMFECRLDNAVVYSLCTSPKHYSGLSEGEHVFRVVAFDREDLRDSSPATHTWVVDLTPPSIEIVAPPSDTKTVHGVLKPEEPVEITTVVGWADVVADISDNLTGVASVVFSVNGVVVPNIMVDADTWKIRFEPDQNGSNLYLIEVMATDGVGNSSTSSVEILGVKTNKPG